MKATELRIGNWININGKPVGIASNVINDIFWHKLDDNNQDNYKPIPLTEEWLYKFGFEKQTDSDDNNEYIIPTSIMDEYLEVRILVSICYTRLIYKPKSKILNQFPLRVLKYVHQLQNLYPVLAGKELIEK